MSDELIYGPGEHTARMPALELVRRLRELGVRSAHLRCGSDGGVYSIDSVEFFPPEPRADSPVVPVSFTQNAPHEEEKCACGHMLPAHNADGLCLLGCEVAKCAAGPKP